MRRRARGRALAGLIAVSALVLAAPQASPGAPAPQQEADASVELVEQTAVVEPRGTFEVRVRTDGVPGDGSLVLVLHQRVRSRSELDLSMTGEGLRSTITQRVTAMRDAPAAQDGGRRLALSLDPSKPGGLNLPLEGVYPLEVIAQDAAGAELTRLVTHLITGPAEGDTAPSLRVAPLVRIGAPVALQPDGTVDLDDRDATSIDAMATVLVETLGVPATVAVTPETLDALVAAGDARAPIVDALRRAVDGRELLARPYVDTTPDSLDAAGLPGELGPQLERGSEALATTLGVDPSDRTWLASPDLGTVGLATAAFTGAELLVVSDEQVEPLEPGLVSYSLAQPFLVEAPDPDADVPQLPAMAVDPGVAARLAQPGSPGLVASRVLAELAMIRLEQPSLERGVVLPFDAAVSPAAMEQVLAGIGSGRPFDATTVSGLVRTTELLLDGADNPVERSLVPTTPDSISADAAAAVRRARSDVDTYASAVTAGDQRAGMAQRQVLVAVATGMADARRRAHAEAASTAVDEVLGAISTPATFTLTLTSREGTIPLVVRNTSGVPVRVRVVLRSGRLEFPEGNTFELELTEETTRRDIVVRSRTSGAFPLTIRLETPDGTRELATSRYTVRSTAVPGVGLVLSIGAGLFLIVWWASHWRRTRRSARLVETPSHPSMRGEE